MFHLVKKCQRCWRSKSPLFLLFSVQVLEWVTLGEWVLEELTSALYIMSHSANSPLSRSMTNHETEKWMEIFQLHYVPNLHLLLNCDKCKSDVGVRSGWGNPIYFGFQYKHALLCNVKIYERYVVWLSTLKTKILFSLKNHRKLKNSLKFPKKLGKVHDIIFNHTYKKIIRQLLFL